MKSNTNVVCLPSDSFISYSRVAHSDNFYILPKEIENFIEHARKDLNRDWSILPWTINRAVTLFYKGAPRIIFSYENIEDNIVGCLDIVNAELKE